MSFQADTYEDDNIRRSIALHERSVADLLVEIERLMHDIRKIRFDILQHQEAIRYNKGKITLARRLPPEILATIFETCTLDGWTRAPLAVSHVCSEWRRAAQIPSVWSQVYVNVDNLRASDRIRFWLTKSGSAPIDIFLDVQNYAGPIPEIMDILTVHRQRWRSLTVACLQLAPADDILRWCTGPFPILRTLRLSIEEEFGILANGAVEEIAQLHSLRNSFNDSPQLRNFIISRNIPPFGGDIPSTVTNLTINLNGLSTISLSTPPLLDVLIELLLLESLTISLARAQDTSFISNPNAEHTFPSLKALTLVGEPDLFALLQSVHTPALLRLHLISSGEPVPVSDRWTGSSLLQWLQLGNTSLELLELRDVDVTKDVFIECFASLTDLRTLKLHDSEIPDAVLESLQGTQGYCPNLAQLDLRWCSQFHGRKLVELVKSRKAATPIESVTVINCSFVEEQDILALASCTVCQLVLNPNDRCRSAGCCENERYRKRLKLRRIGDGMDEIHRRRIIL